MDVRLVLADSKKRRQTLYLHKPEAVIGRQQGCDVRIPSAEVSRRHCVLRARDGYVTVEDLNSSNGTQLNGEPVSGRQVVRPGDRLTVGPVTFVVEYQLTSEAINKLLRGEDSGGAYSDLEVVAEASAVPAPVEEDLLPLEPVEDEELPTLDPVEEEEVPIDQLEEVAEDVQLPESEDLRDILTGLEADETPPPKKRKKK